MGHSLKTYLSDAFEISISDESLRVVREGWRSLQLPSSGPPTLAYCVAGQLPYFYREPAKIAADFAARHHALDMIVDLATKVPTVDTFQRSHCGEILAALYLEEMLGLTRLYSKLTLLTAENTNAHKMDGLFVDLNAAPFVYYLVEAKTSILPTPATAFTGHRHGILKSIIGSLGGYTDSDARFDLVLARDSLEAAPLKPYAAQIHRDLTPPGPVNCVTIGIAVINQATICAPDDDYILTEACAMPFSFRSIVVADLRRLAADTYSQVTALKTAKDQ